MTTQEHTGLPELIAAMNKCRLRLKADGGIHLEIFNVEAQEAALIRDQLQRIYHLPPQGFYALCPSLVRHFESEGLDMSRAVDIRAARRDHFKPGAIDPEEIRAQVDDAIGRQH